MKQQKWKKQIVKPNRILWTKGKFVAGKGHPNWVYLDQKNGNQFEVGAHRKINPKTKSGHFKSFITKSSALKFVQNYINKNGK